ncbi:MAG: DUF488 domain-containing protein [bacterium]
MSENLIYTLGYTAFEPEQMIAALHEYGIHCLVDVRTVPASGRWPHYSKPVMVGWLKSAGLRYRHYPEFGARQSDPQWYAPEGYLDFARYIGSEPFHVGVNKLAEGMRLGYRFALMCAEKDPINCHRAIMVSRGFVKVGMDVAHIRADDTGAVYLEPHAALERRLMLKFGDDPDQLSLLETPEERLNRAYRRQNAAIGYRMEDE